ncbi:MAG: MBL fold metallo-hydrolase [Deltaproteobacteria bacterium]|nr:MBL fold metallo-hydrolase [Deltaproteobacteria bacterium]
MSPPREAAAVALLRRPHADAVPEVFLVRRSRRLVFLGGFHAFPGGSVDAADADVRVRAPPIAGGYVSAAIRELFEETGVLLAGGAERLALQQRRELRRALVGGERRWPEVVSSCGLELDGQSLRPIGQWLTPPYTRTVFHAHYVAALLPQGQAPEIWEGELDQGRWISPVDAIRAHAEGELFIAYPVLETLKVLARHGSDLDAACAALDNRDNFYPHAGGELITGVHVVPLRSPTLPPATHTNTYVLGNRELVVVDPASPYPEEQARLFSYLELLAARGGTVKEIWLSHHHEDHTGATGALRDRLQVPVAAHRETARLLAGKLEIDRQIADRERTPLPATLGPDFDWEAIHTPGHAPGHLCFYEHRLRSILTGDLVVATGTVVIAPPNGNMTDYMASLERLLALELGFMFPGHGAPLAASREKLVEYIQHRKERETAILKTVEVARTPAEIVKIIYA